MTDMHATVAPKSDQLNYDDVPNGRAITMNATKGFIRILSDKATRIVIGAQIAGPGASDLISEFALAIENGLTTEDISMTVHPHPTLGEAIMDTSELADGVPIHI